MSSAHNTNSATFELMVKAGMHFGRKKSVFHPNMKPFVFTVKESIHILDLAKTIEYLDRATDYIKKAKLDGKTILFVAATKQSVAPIEKLARALNMPYVLNRWLGGLLTNFKTITSRVTHLEDLEREQREGLFERYTKKERVMKEREIAALKSKFDGIRTLKKMPDILFLSSLKESQLPLREAKMTKVETVAIVNTDSDPRQVNVAIPANDTSKKSVEFILEYIQQKI